MALLSLFAALEVAAAAIPPEAAPEPRLARPLAAGAVISPGDLQGAVGAATGLVGKELRRYLPAGAALSAADLREPAMVVRNRPVRLEFARGALSISVDGRALSSGAAGETIRVLNLGSKTVVEGVVVGQDRVEVR